MTSLLLGTLVINQLGLLETGGEMTPPELARYREYSFTPSTDNGPTHILQLI